MSREAMTPIWNWKQSQQQTKIHLTQGKHVKFSFWKGWVGISVRPARLKVGNEKGEACAEWCLRHLYNLKHELKPRTTGTEVSEMQDVSTRVLCSNLSDNLVYLGWINFNIHVLRTVWLPPIPLHPILNCSCRWEEQNRWTLIYASELGL